VGELAEEQQISRPAVSQIVQILVEKGLVIRQTDAHDRRYVHLEITQSAAELLEAVYGKNRRWMAEKMASLNEEQLKTIQAAMEMLKKTFDPAAD
jgi:DNA-binding MarR family transcriptional regulator